MSEQAENTIVQINRTNITLVIPPDEDWVKYVTQYGDIFGRTYYCGYWLAGIEHNKKRGWLAFEAVDEKAPKRAPRAVLKAWRDGEALPERWHRIDRELALRAQAEAVKLRGIDWQANADGPFYDCIIQRALFGEEKYG